MTEPASADESSLRYPGWRVVFACFLVELFIFGFGLYGLGVFLAELKRLYDWPTVLLSTASTLSLLLGNLLVVYASDLMTRVGPRKMLLAGIAALTSALVLLAFTTTPWQLYIAYALMSLGWTGMGTVVVAAIISAWFERRHGLALSLAYNGATCGGIVVAPMLLLLVGTLGFRPALLLAAATMAAILVPIVVALVHLPRSAPPTVQNDAGQQAAGDLKPDLAPASRWMLLQSRAFWLASAPFALASLAQVGFLVHQIAILEPSLGRPLAGAAVSLSAVMAVIGRLCLGVLADRLDPRLTTAGSVASQAVALIAIAQSDNAAVLLGACAAFGFSAGNLITLRPLIIRREFPPAAFGVVLGLSTAVGGVAAACGPSLVGLIRSASQSYSTPLLLCAVLMLLAGVGVLLRPQPVRQGAAGA
jgi:MFS family permease